MHQLTDTFDLSTLDLRPGEARNLDVRVRMPPVALAGEHYEVAGGGLDSRVEISRTVGGYALRLRFDAPLAGVCMRCLGDAGQNIEIDAREVDQPGEGEDLRSPYLDGNELDLTAWARDALVLALPARVLCSPDCRGLCAGCGANLNGADPGEHVHDQGGDPRWAKLREWRQAE